MFCLSKVGRIWIEYYTSWRLKLFSSAAQIYQNTANPAPNLLLVVFKHSTLESNIDTWQNKQEQPTASSKTMTKAL